MPKKIYWLIQSVLIMGIFLLFYIFYLSFWPFQPQTLTKQVVDVETAEVRANENLIYIVDYCRKGNHAAEVARTIIGDITIPTPIVNTITQPGCRIAKIPLLIPLGTLPGTYHVEIIATFKDFNPIRTIVVKFRTADFNVIE